MFAILAFVAAVMFVDRMLMLLMVSMNLLSQSQPVTHVVIINAVMPGDQDIELEEVEDDLDLPSDWDEDEDQDDTYHMEKSL